MVGVQGGVYPVYTYQGVQGGIYRREASQPPLGEEKPLRREALSLPRREGSLCAERPLSLPRGRMGAERPKRRLRTLREEEHAEGLLGQPFLSLYKGAFCSGFLSVIPGYSCYSRLFRKSGTGPGPGPWPLAGVRILLKGAERHRWAASPAHELANDRAPGRPEAGQEVSVQVRYIGD